MTRKSTIFYAIFLIGIGNTNAQKDLECKTKLSMFHEPAKAKKYDVAYEPWLYVKTNCPDLSLATYADGEKILKHKIENTKGDEKKRFVEDLLELWKARQNYFSSNTPKGEFGAKGCQLLYDHKDELGKSKAELYNCFTDVFNTDKETFTHPKSLYTYFSLMVELFDGGKKADAELFNTYDDINEKIQTEIQNYSEKMNVLISKIESGKTLNQKEDNQKKVYESYLKNYTLIQDNIDAMVSRRANCDNLIPLYSRGFEVHKKDSIWLKRAVSRMYHKQCTEALLYENLVKQYDEIAPSADTKVYVATVLLKKGKNKDANQYLERVIN
ncbi:hypothetical protein [Winogradskyella flava]|uniref:hypothetical protein n=1 Tax=Winogradskyella flava TaxID=1884876 RepID=UPI002490F262|nr:hypothetical protein [Winogradskyella flava]